MSNKSILFTKSDQLESSLYFARDIEGVAVPIK